MKTLGEIAIEAGRLQIEKLASPERARSWWLRALSDAPDDPRVVDGLAQVARALAIGSLAIDPGAAPGAARCLRPAARATSLTSDGSPGDAARDG